MIIQIGALVFGSLIGSFLNVCILRIPAGESIVFPRSRCPGCKHIIAWYDNIPILSWFFLWGKCRHCRQKFSVRYALIEGLTAFLAWAHLRQFGLTPEGGIYFSFSCAMVVIAWIDLDHRIIPNVISLPGILIGIMASFLLPRVTWFDSLLGAVLGGGVLLAVAEAYRLVRKVEGMGMGDIKLLGMIGAFLGYRPLLFILLISSLSGAVVGSAFIIFSKKDFRYQIPFGTFLAGSAVIHVLWGFAVIRFIEHFLPIRFP